MSAFLALVRRELGVYFVSPAAYIILTALLFLAGMGFIASMSSFATNQLPADYLPTLFFVAWVIAMASPMITMRLLAEENKSGTIEILLTAPISETQLVLAKFLSTLVFQVYLLALTVVYPVIISMYGQVDVGAVVCGYLGVLLVGGMLFSIGLFISSLCSNQITAGVVSLVVMMILLMATLAGPLWQNEMWYLLLDHLSLNAIMMDFLRGLVDTRRLVFILSVTVFFLFVTCRVVESRRWR